MDDNWEWRFTDWILAKWICWINQSKKARKDIIYNLSEKDLLHITLDWVHLHVIYFLKLEFNNKDKSQRSYFHVHSISSFSLRKVMVILINGSRRVKRSYEARRYLTVKDYWRVLITWENISNAWLYWTKEHRILKVKSVMVDLLLIKIFNSQYESASNRINSFTFKE